VEHKIRGTWTFHLNLIIHQPPVFVFDFDVLCTFSKFDRTCGTAALPLAPHHK
jgi:hypothetical protein